MVAAPGQNIVAEPIEPDEWKVPLSRLELLDELVNLLVRAGLIMALLNIAHDRKLIPFDSLILQW
jgi:hypothetical protein